MAAKEDILEQLVEDYLIHKGYFVQHNVKFKLSKYHPDFVSKYDSNDSDIDVLAVHPLKSGPDSVWAVSCKSWQSGFSPQQKIDHIVNNQIVSGREAWKSFRELVQPKWSSAFTTKVAEITGSEEFTHVIAVSRIKGDKSAWEQYQPFMEALGGQPLKLISFEEMFREVSDNLTTTLASTELGRTIQLLKAAKLIS